MKKDNKKFQLAKLAVEKVVSEKLEQVLDIMRAERLDTITQAWDLVEKENNFGDFQRAAYFKARADGESRAIGRLELEKNKNQVWMDEMSTACVEAALKEFE